MSIDKIYKTVAKFVYFKAHL